VAGLVAAVPSRRRSGGSRGNATGDAGDPADAEER
jgi:hypothetical protein